MNKMITLVQLDKEIITERINDFEIKYDIKIPLSFREILLNYNVCKPNKTFYKNNKIEFNLNYFFGISEDKYQSLFENYETYLDRMPDMLFPIGSVDGGDLLCIHKETEDIYYWFHEQDDWGIEGINKWPEMVANGIDEYINGLTFSELPTAQEIETAKKQSKVKITPISVKIKNEQREKQGLPPLSFEEWDALLNG